MIIFFSAVDVRFVLDYFTDDGASDQRGFAAIFIFSSAGDLRFVFDYFTGGGASDQRGFAANFIFSSAVDVRLDWKSTRLNSSHPTTSRMPSSA